MKHKIILVVCALILIMLNIGAFFTFTEGLLQKSRSDSENALRTSLTHNVYNVRNDLNNTVQKTTIIADSFADIADFHGERARQLLRTYNDSAHLQTLWLANTKGLAQDGNGHIYPVSNSLAFHRALLGETVLTDDVISGNRTLVIGSPVIKNGQVRGVILGEYDIFALTRVINLESFNDESYASLIKKDGTFLVDAASEKTLVKGYPNLYTALGQVNFSQPDGRNQMLENIKLNKEGFVSYSLNGESRILYYMPLGINDWYLTKTVTSKVINSNVDPVKELLKAMYIKTLIIFILLSALVYYVLHRLQKRKLQESLKCKTLADNIPGGVAELLVSTTCTIKYANEGFFRLIGYTREELARAPMNGNLFNIMYVEDIDDLKKLLPELKKKAEPLNFDARIRARGRKMKWITGNGRVIDVMNKGSIIQAVFTDITTVKQKEIDLLKLSQTDKMTNLYNKVSTHDLIEAAFQRPTILTRAFAVLDIDNFKRVNDTYGHLAGDKAIVGVAQALTRCFPQHSIAGRVGGDEFVLYIEYDSQKEQLPQLLKHLMAEFNAIYFHEDAQPLSCSIGVITARDFSDATYDEIFAAADKNLYIAKHKEKGTAEITSWNC